MRTRGFHYDYLKTCCIRESDLKRVLLLGIKNAILSKLLFKNFGNNEKTLCGMMLYL